MTSATSSLDPVLSWGSSVNVSEDLRRSIRAECDQLDTQISAITTQTTSESRKAQSLSKDLNFSVQEMKYLVRDGSEEMEGCIMNSTVRGRMAEQLEIELGSLLNATNDQVIPQDQDGYLVTNNDSETSTKPMILSQYLADSKATFQKIELQVRDNVDIIRRTRQIIKDVERETNAHLERIASDDLNSERSNLEHEVNLKKRELEGEKTKMKSVLDQVQRARKRCGDQAQQIAQLTKNAADLKKENAEKESNFSLQLESATEMESTLVDELSELQSTLNSLESNLDIVRRGNEEVVAIRHRESEVKEERGEVSRSIKELTIEREKFEEELNKVISDVAKAELEWKRLQDEKLTLEKDIEESNESENLETGNIRLATYERMKLAEEKVELVRIINETASKDETGNEEKPRLDTNMKLLELKAALNAVKAEREITEAEFSSAAEECNIFKLKLTDLRSSMTTEISSLEKLCIDYKSAAKAEEEELVCLTKEFENRKVKYYEEMKSSSSRDLKEAQLRLMVLKEAKEIIYETEIEKEKILSRNISKRKDETRLLSKENS